MKNTILPICAMILLIACTSQEQEYAKLAQNSTIEDFRYDTFVRVASWCIGKGSVFVYVKVENPCMVAAGEVYLEIEPEQFIAINTSEGNKDFYIFHEKMKRNVYIRNLSEENAAYITLTEGRAVIRYNDKLYQVNKGETMYIPGSGSVEIGRNKHILAKIETIK